MKYADSFPERHFFFNQVIAPVLIDKTTTGKVAGIGAETGVVVLTGDWVNSFKEGHGIVLAVNLYLYLNYFPNKKTTSRIKARSL